MVSLLIRLLYASLQLPLDSRENKTREMSVWAKFAKISSRENFYLYSIHFRTWQDFFYYSWRPSLFLHWFQATVLSAIVVDVEGDTKIFNEITNVDCFVVWYLSLLVDKNGTKEIQRYTKQWALSGQVLNHGPFVPQEKKKKQKLHRVFSLNRDEVGWGELAKKEIQLKPKLPT